MSLSMENSTMVISLFIIAALTVLCYRAWLDYRLSKHQIEQQLQLSNIEKSKMELIAKAISRRNESQQ